LMCGPQDDSCDDAWDISHGNVWSDVYTGAWSTAYDVLEGAVRDANRHSAWSEVYDCIFDVAYCAIHSAVPNVDDSSSFDAAYVAAFRARLLMGEGLDVPQEHVDFINGLWDVWASGYGCAGYEDGKYWVYKL